MNHEPWYTPSILTSRCQLRYAKKLHKSFDTRQLFDAGQLSEPIAFLHLFREWLARWTEKRRKLWDRMPDGKPWPRDEAPISHDAHCTDFVDSFTGLRLENFKTFVRDVATLAVRCAPLLCDAPQRALPCWHYFCFPHFHVKQFLA